MREREREEEMTKRYREKERARVEGKGEEQRKEGKQDKVEEWVNTYTQRRAKNRRRGLLRRRDYRYVGGMGGG